MSLEVSGWRILVAFLLIWLVYDTPIDRMIDQL